LQKIKTKIEHKEQKIEQNTQKQQENINLVYSRVLRVLSNKRKELSKLLSLKNEDAKSNLSKNIAENSVFIKRMQNVKVGLGQFLENPSAFSIEDYIHKIEFSQSEVSEIEQNCKNMPKKKYYYCFLENIQTNDSSELRQIKGKSHRTKGENTTRRPHRARSTANKKQNNPTPQTTQNTVETPSQPEICQILSQISHRNGTVSPRKDADLCILSPTCSESTAPSLGATLLSVKCVNLDSSKEEEKPQDVEKDNIKGFVQQQIIQANLTNKTTRKIMHESKGSAKYDSMLNYKTNGSGKICKKSKDLRPINHCRITYETAQ